jgi:uncharacterized protein YegP (UPF0339 family)
MTGTITFTTYQGRDGQWYWNGTSSNGKIVCDGAEGYVTNSNARRAVRRFIRTMSMQNWKIAK